MKLQEAKSEIAGRGRADVKGEAVEVKGREVERGR